MEEKLLRAFRWTALAVGAIASTDAFLLHQPSSPLSRGFFIVGIGLFIAAFWINTRRLDAPRSMPGLIARHLAQLPACLAVPDLLFVLALEASLILSGRPLKRWVVLQALATVGILSAHAPHVLIEMREYTHLSPRVAAGLRLFNALGWQAVIVSAGVLAANALRSRRELARLNAELGATEELLAEGARSAERSRVAREVDDVLGHQLAELVLHLELAAQRAGPVVTAALRSAQAVSRRLLSEVRDILNMLRPASGGVHVDLGAALRTLVAGIEEPHLHLSVPEPLVVSPLATHVAFRCVQEAVTNSLRHSGAGNVWIRLRSGEGALEVQVRDDGRGVATLREGHGLLGIQDRVAEAGGEVRIETAVRRGFDVSVVLPLGNGETSDPAPGAARP